MIDAFTALKRRVEVLGLQQDRTNLQNITDIQPDIPRWLICVKETCGKIANVSGTEPSISVWME